jgi:hypothetical protein
MTPKTQRPAWACTQWDNPEHNWHDCANCLAAYETLIDQAQDLDDDDENAADIRSAAPSGGTYSWP